MNYPKKKVCRLKNQHRFHQLVLTSIGKELFYLLAGLVVHDVYFYRETFAFEELKLLFVGGKNRRVFHVRDREAKDGIRFVMVDDEEAYVAGERHEWEGSRQVVIHHARLLVGKCAKAEYVAGGGGVIVLDDVGIAGLRSAPTGRSGG